MQWDRTSKHIAEHLSRGSSPVVVPDQLPGSGRGAQMVHGTAPLLYLLCKLAQG